MGSTTHISWCDATFNPWRGCTKVSTGCKNCYAETLSGRNPAVLGVWGPKGKRAIAAESYWQEPLKWDRQAQKEGVRQRIFCASLADVFEGDDTIPEVARAPVRKARLRLLALIFDTTHLDWLLLTKRPENILPLLRQAAGAALDDPKCGLSPEAAGKAASILYRWLDGSPPTNVWLGTSAEDQAAYDQRSKYLTFIPAAVRFLSVEPLLGSIDMRLDHNSHDLSRCIGQDIHWVIVGGESGSGARPCDVAWVRSLITQCESAGVACFVKQLGANIQVRQEFGCLCGTNNTGFVTNKQAWRDDGDFLRFQLHTPKGGDMAEWPENLRVREFPGTEAKNV